MVIVLEPLGRKVKFYFLLVEDLAKFLASFVLDFVSNKERVTAGHGFE